MEPEETPERSKREEYEDIRSQKLKLEGLVEHPGWKLLLDVLEEQSSIRKNKLLLPARSIKRVLEQELEKGELMGLQLAVSMPDALIEQHEAAIEQLKADGALDTGSNKS